MGRDTRANSTGYHTRAKLYKRIVDEKDRSRIYYSPSPIIFYAKYHNKFSFFNPNLNRVNVGEVFQRESNGTYIITRDLRPDDVQTNDRVEFEGVNYEVMSIEVSTFNRQTEVSNRTECEIVMRIE